MAKKTTKQAQEEVVEENETSEELATSGGAITSEPVIDFEEDADAGREGAGQESYSIPYILLLQGLSPQVDKLDDAKPGLYCDSVTEELFKELLVIPCAYKRSHIRWAPREKGGGFKGEYQSVLVDTAKDELDGQPLSINEKGRLVIGGEDTLADTRAHYVLYFNPEKDRWCPAILSMAGSKVKVSKRWMTVMSSIELTNSKGKKYNPATFSHIYKLTTVKEEKNGNSYYNVEFSVEGQVTDPGVYQMAKAFNAAYLSGAVKESAPVEDADGSEGSGSEGKF
jgi:hypothetical protein